MTELVIEILQTCVVPLLGILTAFLVKWIKKKNMEIDAKIDNDLAKKYFDMLSSTIETCVLAVQQTYVDGLKKEDAFTKEKQVEAFNKCKEQVLAILGQDAIEYLTALVGDLDSYLDAKIESEVKKNKGTA